MFDTATIGQYGEEIAKRFLIKRGYTVLDLNKRYKVSELDIVACKENKLFVVEVKTSLATYNPLQRPEERVDNRKRQKLRKAVSLYMQKFPEKDVQFMVCAVRIQEKPKRAWVTIMDDLVL
jgi:putative endonuclease